MCLGSHLVKYFRGVDQQRFKQETGANMNHMDYVQVALLEVCKIRNLKYRHSYLSPVLEVDMNDMVSVR